MVGLEGDGVGFDVGESVVETDATSDREVGALKQRLHCLGGAPGKVRKTDRVVEAFELRVCGAKSHGIETDIDESVGIGADGSEARIDDDVIDRAVGLGDEHIDEAHHGFVAVLGIKALAGGAIRAEALRGHDDTAHIVLANELNHAVEVVARCGEGIEQRFAAALAAIEGLEGNLVVFDVGIVEAEGDVGGLLNSGNDEGQEFEHLLDAHGHLLGAIDVEIYELGAGIGLEFGEMLKTRNVSGFPSAAGAGVGVVDQLPDNLGIGDGGSGRGG